MNEFKTKKEQIKSLLQAGCKPEEISEEVGSSLRYVYLIKSEIGMVKEKEPTTHDHIADIRKNLEAVSKEVHALTLKEAGFFVVCPACREIFDYESGEVCQECYILFCSPECVSKHQEKDWLEDKSKCEKNQEIVSSLVENEAKAWEPEKIEEPTKSSWDIF